LFKLNILTQKCKSISHIWASKSVKGSDLCTCLRKKISR